MTHTLTLPIGHDGTALHATIESAPRGGYHASWLLFDDDSNIVAESPNLPRWYMDYCPNEVAQFVTVDALHAIGQTADDEELAYTFPCTCDDE